MLDYEDEGIAAHWSWIFSNTNAIILQVSDGIHPVLLWQININIYIYIYRCVEYNKLYIAVNDNSLLHSTMLNVWVYTTIFRRKYTKR